MSPIPTGAKDKLTLVRMNRFMLIAVKGGAEVLKEKF
jgi:hypothetical protein